MKAKDPLTGTQAAGSFPLPPHKAPKRVFLIPSIFLPLLIAATASSWQLGKQFGDLQR